MKQIRDFNPSQANPQVVRQNIIHSLISPSSDTVTYLDEPGQERPIVMGSYGIGPARIAAVAIAENHDKNGISWPDTIAPLQIHLLVVNRKEPKMATVAAQRYADLNRAGLEVLYDDRDERPGVKFKHADRLGWPLRVTVGSRALREGLVEIRRRRTGEEIAVAPGEVVARVRGLVGRAL